LRRHLVGWEATSDALDNLLLLAFFFCFVVCSGIRVPLTRDSMTGRRWVVVGLVVVARASSSAVSIMVDQHAENPKVKAACF